LLREKVEKLSFKEKNLARRKLEVARLRDNGRKAKALTHFARAGAERVHREAAFRQVIATWRRKRLAMCMPMWSTWKQKVRTEAVWYF
jgi:hypothetical protein